MDYAYATITENITLHRMVVELYDKTYGTDYRQFYGQDLVAVGWATKSDANGELIAETMENLLEYAGDKYAYTSRGVAMEATLQEAIKVVLDSMEGF
jgi:hypothetical protein